ncbi:MAG: cell division protein FtsQ/DivIB, partial [Candidatus Limisoma sp.]
MKVKKITLIVVSVLLAAYVVVAFPFVKLLKQDDCCKGVDIVIDYAESVKFVTVDYISSQLNEMGIAPEGKRIVDIDIADIEKRLKAKDYIENVECYITADNLLHIDIKPLQPVMRVFDGADSYYVNKDNKRMQSNADFFIDRPVVKGRFTPEYPPTRLLPLIDFLDKSKRWRDLTGMIEVRDSNNIFLRS